jgi:enoyl-CoA hydratase/carnithine racemase
LEYQDLLLEKQDHIALVTLNIPQKLNALTNAMFVSIGKVTQDLASDDEVRVVVITGAGRGFCSGADVGRLVNRGSTTPTRFEKMQNVGYPIGDAFPRLNKPVIAAINGPCTGAGLSLALSCDIRIASETARFGASQILRGLVPDAGMTMHLPLVVGISNAFKIMYTGELINAAEAKEMGIVSQVVPNDILIQTVMELANKIAQNPPYSLELTKMMVWRGKLDQLTRQIDLETWAQNICFTTEDHHASVQAFMNKLPTPKYIGK